MKPVNLTKEERRRRREADIAAYRALPPEKQEAFIKERREAHVKAFQEKKEKEDKRRTWQKGGIALLSKHKHAIFRQSCDMMVVAHPIKRDPETKEILQYPIFERDGNKEFEVTIAVRHIEGTCKHGLERMHMAFTIRSPKDSDNERDAKAHLGYRMELGSPMSMEFTVPVDLWERDTEYNSDFEDVCWHEFDSYVRHNVKSLPARFVRSWFADASCRDCY